MIVDGVLELGDAGADHQAVERGAGQARLLDEALAADLELPQVRVEEEGVELRRAALVEQLGEPGDVVGEDLLGDLATAGELGPVAGVRGGRDDLRVDGGRGHPGEQDRRLAGEAGEGRVDDRLAVAAVDQRGGVRRPVGRRGHLGAGGEEEVASLVVAAGMTVMPRPRSARPVMLAERSAGPRSTTQRVSGPMASVSSRGQSTVSTQIAWARCSARPSSRPQASAHSRTMSTAGARAGWWKPRATGIDSTVGLERASAADLGVELGGLGVAALLDGLAEAAEGGRRAAHHDAARTVDGADDDDVRGRRRPRRRGPRPPRGWRRRRRAWGSPRRAGRGPARRPTMVAAAPMRRAMAIRSTSLDGGPGGASRRPAKAATPRMPWLWPTEATGAIAVRSRPSAASRSRVASWVSSTPGRPSAAPIEVGRLRVLVAVEPHLRLERARQRGGDLAGDGRDAAARLLDQVGQTGRCRGSRRRARVRVANQSVPWPPKVTANSSPSRSRSARFWPRCDVARGSSGRWSTWSGGAESYEECVMFTP